MKTVVLASCTPEEEAMLAERRRLAQDRHDEVWQGEYHMNPAPHPRHGITVIELSTLLAPIAKQRGFLTLAEFNVGVFHDHRVPDLGLLRSDQPLDVWNPTAALVVEVVSPDDESWLKFDFYAAHDVDEVVIVDSETNTVHWFALRDGAYERVDRSELLDLAVAEVEEAIDWS
jgi:Uma2 family endonuclease